MLLALQNVSKHFPSRDGSGLVYAVDDVSLDIAEGKFVTLLGPSGCGKTTTLRLITGFEFPTAGTIMLEGRNINESPPNQRGMSTVFQSYAIFPHLNVFENVAYGLRIKKMAEKDIKRAEGKVLELAELEGVENRAPKQLSGGQQQRVALARALVMEPKVLLFDEPLSNLDAKLRVQMRSEIRRIQQELGITSVYVTHDQDEAMVLSDMIVVMHAGRIQQVGSAVEIYRRPRTRFVADFIGRANFLPVVVEERVADGWRCRLLETSLVVPNAAADTLAAGGEALLLLRPESIRVTTAADGVLAEATQQSLRLPARVKHSAYLGSVVEYEIELQGQPLLAVRHDPSEEHLYPAGTEVAVELLRSNLFLLPAV